MKSDLLTSYRTAWPDLASETKKRNLSAVKLRDAPSPSKVLKSSNKLFDTSLKSSSVLLSGLKTLSGGGNQKSKAPLLTPCISVTDTWVDSEVAEYTPQIFNGKIFVVECSSSVSFKEKIRIKELITSHGGVISHLLNKKVSAVVISDTSCEDTYKCRKAVELSIPVVSTDYIHDCVSSGASKDYDSYIKVGLKRTEQLGKGKIADKNNKTAQKNVPTSVDWKRFECLPKSSLAYVDIAGSSDYTVPKWAFLSNQGKLCVLEIHVMRGDGKRRFYVLLTLYTDKESNERELREADGPLQSELLFASLYSHYTANLKYKRHDGVPVKRGSAKLQETLFSWALDDVELSPTVESLVDKIWDEAVGEITRNLSLDGDSPSLSSISKASVEEAEGYLLEMKKIIQNKSTDSLQQLNSDLSNALPLKEKTNIKSMREVTKYLNIIQLLYDLLSVGEATDWSLMATTKNKLRSLNCLIEKLNPSHEMCDVINELALQDSHENSSDIEIVNVFEIVRPSESINKDGTKAWRNLFHASRPENYMGILSRGLMMPRHVVDDLGGKRTDAGNLGNGIYFADQFSTSDEYTSRFRDNTRLMFYCEVVTGTEYETTNHMPDLTKPPQGHDCVKAVGKTSDNQSQFKSNEYCVYSTDAQCIRYIIEYTTAEDRKRVQDTPPVPSPYTLANTEAREYSQDKTITELIKDDISDRKDLLADVLPGLQTDGDVSVPLQSISVIAKLVDLAAEVTVFQEYYNDSPSPIEAKFVFPLTEMAAVCGFEAYINDKHIVGKVKEKETAHKEYRKAISEGHGAYLMDQDKERPDVFTVSVGNLPPAARCLIKIIYVCELAVQDEKFVFELPSNIAPWSATQAMAQNTQSTVGEIKLGHDTVNKVKCGMSLSVQMPFDIREITSLSHKVQVKRTATQAMIEMRSGQSLDGGFTLSISLAEIHVPRMLIENHPDNPEELQACMLTFYPEFDCTSQQNYEIIILLDMSNSMSTADIINAKKIALVLLNTINSHSSFNLIAFGSTYNELFPKSMPANKSNIKAAVSYIQSCTPRQGNTNLLTLVHNLSQLSDDCRHRNIVLISDGHMTHSQSTLQAVSDIYGSVRLFTLAVSDNANKYMMRELARLGSGVSEYFNSKSKSKWYKQIRGIVEKAGQPLLSQVKVIWQEQNTDLPQPLQAPACVPSLYNGNRVVVYGFASNCFTGTLKAVIDGKEVSTVVYAPPVSASTGLIVHRLAARAVIQDWEHGCLSEDPIEHVAKKKEMKSSIIQMSTEYSIVTQFTSFVAIEERDEEEKSSDWSTGGPTMDDLVEEHTTDLLPYMSYGEGSVALKKIFVQSLTGKSTPLSVHGSMDIKSVKEELLRIEGIPLDQQRLLFKGKQLEDEDTLADHGADKEGTVVHIVLRLRGGKSTVFTNTASFEVEAAGFDGSEQSDSSCEESSESDGDESSDSGESSESADSSSDSSPGRERKSERSYSRSLSRDRDISEGYAPISRSRESDLSLERFRRYARNDFLEHRVKCVPELQVQQEHMDMAMLDMSVFAGAESEDMPRMMAGDESMDCEELLADFSDDCFALPLEYLSAQANSAVHLSAPPLEGMQNIGSAPRRSVQPPKGYRAPPPPPQHVVTCEEEDESEGEWEEGAPDILPTCEDEEIYADGDEDYEICEAISKPILPTCEDEEIYDDGDEDYEICEAISKPILPPRPENKVDSDNSNSVTLLSLNAQYVTDNVRAMSEVESTSKVEVKPLPQPRLSMMSMKKKKMATPLSGRVTDLKTMSYNCSETYSPISPSYSPTSPSYSPTSPSYSAMQTPKDAEVETGAARMSYREKDYRKRPSHTIPQMATFEVAEMGSPRHPTNSFESHRIALAAEPKSFGNIYDIYDDDDHFQSSHPVMQQQSTTSLFSDGSQAPQQQSPPVLRMLRSVPAPDAVLASRCAPSPRAANSEIKLDTMKSGIPFGHGMMPFGHGMMPFGHGMMPKSGRKSAGFDALGGEAKMQGASFGSSLTPLFGSSSRTPQLQAQMASAPPQPLYQAHMYSASSAFGAVYAVPQQQRQQQATQMCSASSAQQQWQPQSLSGAPPPPRQPGFIASFTGAKPGAASAGFGFSGFGSASAVPQKQSLFSAPPPPPPGPPASSAALPPPPPTPQASQISGEGQHLRVRIQPSHESSKVEEYMSDRVSEMSCKRQTIHRATARYSGTSEELARSRQHVRLRKMHMPQQRITRSNEIIIQSENSDMDVELLDETEEKKTELVPGIYTARSTELLQAEGPLLKIKFPDDLVWSHALHIIDNDGSFLSLRVTNFIDMLQSDKECKGMMDDMQEDVLQHLSGFSLSRLVNLLLDAGIKSLGRTASKEVVLMFLLQIHLYISTVVEVCECADALCTLQHVRDTMQEKWKDMSDRIASGDFDADTNAMRMNEIVKKYPGNSLIHRLELGNDWFHVLLNMMCDRKERRLVINLKRPSAIVYPS